MNAMVDLSHCNLPSHLTIIVYWLSICCDCPLSCRV